MKQTLAEILPLALAASLNPTAVLVESAIISGREQGRRDSLLFVIGGTCFLVALGLLVMFFFNHTVLPSDHYRRLSAWIDIILGLLIALVVLRSLAGGRKKESRWARTGRRRPYLIVGFIFMAVNTSTNIPFVAASKAIADNQLPWEEAAVLFVLLVLVTISLMTFPVAFSYAAPQQAERVMLRLNAFFSRYGNRLVQGFFLLVAVYLVWKGLRDLDL